MKIFIWAVIIIDLTLYACHFYNALEKEGMKEKIKNALSCVYEMMILKICDELLKFL